MQRYGLRVVLGTVVSTALLTFSAAQAAESPGGVQIDATSLSLSRARVSGAIRVSNHKATADMMQVHVYAWNRDAGSDTLTPSDDLVGLPLTFALAPSSTQTVRIGMRGPVGGEKEMAYRVIVGEIVPDKRISQGVDMLLAFNFPVYVAPTGKIERGVVWSAKQNDPRHLTLAVQNTGNVHIAFQHLRIRDAKHHDALVDTTVKDTVLAGGRFAWTFEAPPGIDLGSLAIEAATDSGPVVGSLR